MVFEIYAVFPNFFVHDSFGLLLPIGSMVLQICIHYFVQYFSFKVLFGFVTITFEKYAILSIFFVQDNFSKNLAIGVFLHEKDLS
jgi:hypothetical protein